jgi:hypothetical protein
MTIEGREVPRQLATRWFLQGDVDPASGPIHDSTDRDELRTPGVIGSKGKSFCSRWTAGIKEPQLARGLRDFAASDPHTTMSCSRQEFTRVVAGSDNLPLKKSIPPSIRIPLRHSHRKATQMRRVAAVPKSPKMRARPFDSKSLRQSLTLARKEGRIGGA